MSDKNNFREEHDLLGAKTIPSESYCGIHTVRAADNFHISGVTTDISLIHAMAIVKKGCCLANYELGYLDKDKSDAIIRACDEIAEGKFDGQFNLDALQGGAGTSTNMNVNEVIANRAIEILGGEKGDYDMVHPIEDVNLHQSTNDVYPTSLKIAVIRKLRVLSEAISRLQGRMQEKEKEFSDIIKIGRTELQEAVPMTLGMEFSAFAEAFSRDRWRVYKCEERIRTVNIGGTAIGTGLSAPRKYIFLAIEKIREITGIGLARGENLVDQTANTDMFVEVSGILKANAQNLIKIANDLRHMHFLGEIRLPKVQVGSSIMPGKVNPVITECVIQAALKVTADDMLVTEAVSRSGFQINEFMPLVAYALLDALSILINTSVLLAAHTEKIEADKKICHYYAEHSQSLITAFVPVIGYEKASGLITEYLAGGADKSLKLFLEDKLGKEYVDNIFNPDNLTSLGYKDEPNA